MEINITKSIPKKILVLNIANMSRPLEIFSEKIWVIVKSNSTNPAINSNVKKPVDDDIIKNQNDNPAVTARDLNLGDDVSMLNWIDECYKPRLR